MVSIGSGAQREVEDWALSRYACYLVIQNADPSKPLVALGQTYFAVQTRRQEMADDEALNEDKMRLLLRAEAAQGWANSRKEINLRVRPTNQSSTANHTRVTP